MTPAFRAGQVARSRSSLVTQSLRPTNMRPHLKSNHIKNPKASKRRRERREEEGRGRRRPVSEAAPNELAYPFDSYSISS